MITFAILAGHGDRVRRPPAADAVRRPEHRVGVPPPILVFDWPALAVSLSAIMAASAIGLLAALRALLRSSVTSVLRGEAE